jgi:hypothetical protein
MAEASYLSMNPGEKVILEAHRHWVNIAPFFASTVLVVAIGFMLIGYVGGNPEGAERLFPGLTLAIVTPLVALLDVIAVVTLFFAYAVYRQNKIVLTNMHFIQITQTGLFGRTLSKLSLDELQDVRGSRKGVFGTIFNYGEILIETAGNEENFFFRPAPDPLNIAEQINDTHEFYERKNNVPSGINDAHQGPTPPTTPAPPAA